MADNVCINVACQRTVFTAPVTQATPRIYTPGEVISPHAGFIVSHGTYIDGDYLKASVAGVKEQVDKLVFVRPLKNRYNGEIGDVVVGRVTEVQQKRWKVDTSSRLDSNLLISSMNLPGGELRRRSVEDEKMMRKFLQEGDLISAEVQNVFDDGSLSLHTRSLKYGKLSQGILLTVFPSLIRRRKNHFHDLPCGASVILGNNGFIWICPTINTEVEGGAGGFTQNLDKEVSMEEREVMARLRNCILALAANKMSLYDTSILYAFEESQKYKVSELLDAEAMLDVALMTHHRLESQEEP